MLKKTVITVLLSLSLVGCKEKPDFTKVKGTATSLVEKYKPQIEKFQATLTGLLARAKALPGSLPGVSKLLAQLGGHGDTLATAKTTVSGLMGKVDGAIRAGKVADVKKSIEAANTSFAGIETLGDELVKAEGVLKTLEARAIEITKAAEAAKRAKVAKPKAAEAARRAKVAKAKAEAATLKELRELAEGLELGGKQMTSVDEPAAELDH